MKEIAQEQMEQEKKEKERQRYWEEFEKRKQLKEKINIYKENRQFEKEASENKVPNTPALTWE